MACREAFLQSQKTWILNNADVKRARSIGTTRIAHMESPVQSKPESYNMTVLQLEKPIGTSTIGASTIGAVKTVSF